METKHTPGPWRIGRTADAYGVTVGVPNRRAVCKVRERGGLDPIPGTEAAANARLIATAPELLDACIFAYKCTEVGGVDGMSQNEAAMHVRQLLADAIAKATGGEP